MTKRIRMRHEEKDTGRRTSTGNGMTYSGEETNEDCH